MSYICIINNSQNFIWGSIGVQRGGFPERQFAQLRQIRRQREIYGWERERGSRGGTATIGVVEKYAAAADARRNVSPWFKKKSPVFRSARKKNLPCRLFRFSRVCFPSADSICSTSDRGSFRTDTRIGRYEPRRIRWFARIIRIIRTSIRGSSRATIRTRRFG